jgi:hypothetical protein
MVIFPKHEDFNPY